MKNVYKPKVTKKQMGGFANFVKVKQQCFGCPTAVSKGEALCPNCKPKERQIYIERQIELNRTQKIYSDLWVQCQRCQESLHNDVICQNRDCVIFYKRVKSRKDLEEAQKVVDRFDF